MTPDSEFLSLIREQYTVKDAGQAIWLGHEVCRRLAVESDVDVLHYLTNTYNAPRDEALGLESAAMTIYCPQFLGR